ncbi:MAG: two-component system sensor histidine kinase CreC [Formosimonas sp.]
MKISLRILLGYFLIVAIAAWFVLAIFSQEVKPGVRQSTEDGLIDTAQILAPIAALDMQNHNLANGALAHSFAQLNQKPLHATIINIVKTRIDSRVYVTDAAGMVIFDSTGQDVGKDYSRWNDVYLTLRGQYGARSTRTVAGDDSTSVMHVAAPVLINGQIAGVLTVAKPNQSLMPIIERNEQRVMLAGGILLGIALLIGGFFVWWINGSIGKLEQYAHDVAAGRPVSLPRLKSPELQTLGATLERMRQQLEGKAYVEEYVHTLTHELKSPISAIRGATEILQERPPQAIQAQFLGNIAQQTTRLQQLIDRLLALASLERMPSLQLQPSSITHLLEQGFASSQTELTRRNIQLRININQPAILHVDEFFIVQVLSNILSNALDFSPNNSWIEVYDEPSLNHYRLVIRDHGAGIPDYALPHIFERFYSLPRPNQPKSTGLGLNFVQEVMHKHRGTVEVGNHPTGGVCVRLIFAR